MVVEADKFLFIFKIIVLLIYQIKFFLSGVVLNDNMKFHNFNFDQSNCNLSNFFPESNSGSRKINCITITEFLDSIKCFSFFYFQLSHTCISQEHKDTIYTFLLCLLPQRR